MFAVVLSAWTGAVGRQLLEGAAFEAAFVVHSACHAMEVAVLIAHDLVGLIGADERPRFRLNDRRCFHLVTVPFICACKNKEINK